MYNTGFGPEPCSREFTSELLSWLTVTALFEWLIFEKRRDNPWKIEAKPFVDWWQDTATKFKGAFI